MAKSNLVKINSIDVSSKRIRTQIIDEYRDKIGKAVIDLRFDVNSLITLEKFQEVIIWEAYSGTLEQDSNRKFKGNIAKIERNTGTIRITAFDSLWKAIQADVNQTFDKNIDSEAGEGSEIFKSLATDAGLTADSTTVQDTGTGTTDIVLDKFVCQNAEVYERMQALSEIYRYQFYYMADVDKVYFEPEGFSTNTNTLTSGGTASSFKEFLKWKEDATKIFNRIEIIGAFDELNKTEEFDGDASTTQFTLQFEPEIVQVTVDGVEKTGGVIGGTSTFDYSVDKENKQINFVSAPASGTDNVDVFYSYRQPRTVIRDNESSISELGRTIKNRFTFGDIRSVDDAERRGDKLLDIYSEPFVTTKGTLTPAAAQTVNPIAGQTIRVVDDRQGFDVNMVIKKTITTYPENEVILELGDKEVRVGDAEYDNSKRLKRLEEERSREGTLITASKDLRHVNRVYRRDLRVREADYDATHSSSIWGRGTAQGFHDWNAGKWSDRASAFDAEVEDSISQGDNVYRESFTDADYKDAGNTTATWTTTGSATFTSGQKITSSSINKNNGTVTTAKLTSTEVSGTLLYEMSANGGTNWETVTSGTKHFFTNTGTDLRFRVTENAASTAEISNILINEYT